MKDRRRCASRRWSSTIGWVLVAFSVAVPLACSNDNKIAIPGGGEVSEVQVDAVAVAPKPDDDPSDEGTMTDIAWAEAATMIGGEVRPGVFWTGREVLVMRTENGGGEITGERWHPETNNAERIAPSGLAWRVNAAMGWTGDELLLIGGSNGPGIDQIGVAYNPADDTWRAIADPPGQTDAWERSVGGPAIWTGSELVLWRDSLAYVPSTDTWRTVAEAPLSERARAATAWQGSHLVVWGGCHLRGTQCDELNAGLLGDGALYDPTTDRWSMLPESPLMPAVHMVAAQLGAEIIFMVTLPGDDTGERAAIFDPQMSEWRVIAPPPLSNRTGAAGVWTGTHFVVWGGRTVDGRGLADGAVYDPVSGQWSLLPAGPGTGRSLHTMIQAGDDVYISASQYQRRTLGPPLVLHLPGR